MKAAAKTPIKLLTCKNGKSVELGTVMEDTRFLFSMNHHQIRDYCITKYQSQYSETITSTTIHFGESK